MHSLLTKDINDTCSVMIFYTSDIVDFEYVIENGWVIINKNGQACLKQIFVFKVENINAAHEKSS